MKYMDIQFLKNNYIAAVIKNIGEAMRAARGLSYRKPINICVHVLPIILPTMYHFEIYIDKSIF